MCGRGGDPPVADYHVERCRLRFRCSQANGMGHRSLHSDDIPFLLHSVAVAQFLVAADGKGQVEGPEPCRSLLHREPFGPHHTDKGLSLVRGLIGENQSQQYALLCRTGFLHLLSLVGGWVGDAGLTEGLASLLAGAALAAVLFSPLIAGVGVTVVHAQLCTTTDNV